MRLLLLALMLILSGCATYQPYPEQRPYYPERQSNINVGGGVDSQGNAAGWFSTILRIGQCALMPTVTAGTYRDKASGHVQVNCSNP